MNVRYFFMPPELFIGRKKYRYGKKPFIVWYGGRGD